MRTRERPRPGGYVLDDRGKPLHVILYREAYGKIPKGWIVHHIDENKRNNAIDNLIALPREFHDRLHALQRQNSIRYTREYLETLVPQLAEQARSLEQKLKECYSLIESLKTSKHTLGIEALTEAVDKMPKRETPKPAPEIALPAKSFESKTILRKGKDSPKVLA